MTDHAKVQARDFASSLDSASPVESCGATSSGSALGIGKLREIRRVRLRTIELSDVELLYRVELSQEIGVRWRFRGTTPSPSEFSKSLWQNTLATFLVERRDTGATVGLVSIYRPDLARQRAFFSLAAFPGYERTPAVLDGALLAINYAFSVWPFRKLYAEVLEFNLDQVSSISRHLFSEEARLAEWDFFDDRWWDLVYFSLSRDRWLTQRPRLLGRIL